MFIKKKSICKYIIHTEFLNKDIPKGLFPNIEKTFKENKFGCPSISYINDRLYTVNSFIDIEFIVGVKDNEPYYTYSYNDKKTPINDEVHDLIKNITNVEMDNNGVVSFQFLLPYAFVTDDKDLDVITLEPSITKKNFKYVSGGLKPFNWIRNLNSTWELKDNTKTGTIIFNIDKPVINYVFNKSVNLEYTEVTKTILNYLNQNKFIINYRKSLNQVTKNIITRRTKKLL